MKVQYTPRVIEKLKKLDVRIRKSFQQKILIFSKNPLDPQLKNHELRESYKGLRSINITADYRAIYEELTEDEEEVAYFVLFGTHPELYRSET